MNEVAIELKSVILATEIHHAYIPRSAKVKTELFKEITEITIAHKTMNGQLY